MSSQYDLENENVSVDHTAPIRDWVEYIRRCQSRSPRRNSLSTGSTLRSTNSTSWAKRQPKNLSFLQLLPLELRHMIYAYVLDDQPSLHLAITKQIFVVPDCATEDFPTNPFPDCDRDLAVFRHLTCVCEEPGGEYGGEYGDISETKSKLRHLHGPLHLLNLVKSCRQM
jgi:hypothetical protein